MAIPSPVLTKERPGLEPVLSLDDIKEGDDLVIERDNRRTNFFSVKPSPVAQYPSVVHGIHFQGSYIILGSEIKFESEYSPEDKKLVRVEAGLAFDTILASMEIDQGNVYKLKKTEFS